MKNREYDRNQFQNHKKRLANKHKNANQNPIINFSGSYVGAAPIFAAVN